MSARTMTGRRINVRRVWFDTWLVYRVNPVTGEIDTFELTCERGTFLAHYRMLGHVDDTSLTDRPTQFDPAVDEWCKDPIASWSEVVETRIR